MGNPVFNTTAYFFLIDLDTTLANLLANVDDPAIQADIADIQNTISEWLAEAEINF